MGDATKFTFKVSAADLNAAFDMVAIVTPKPLNSTGGEGYLFTTNGETGSLYSRDRSQVSRAQFKISEPTGEGAFIIPTNQKESFKYLSDDILFEIVQDGANRIVNITSDGSTVQQTSLDPALFSSCESELKRALDNKDGQHEFPVGLLRKSLALSSPFFPEPKNAKEELKTIQIFDKNYVAEDKTKPYENGDGFLYTDGGSGHMFHFHSEAFVGKSFALHQEHQGKFLQFLNSAVAPVTFVVGGQHNYAVDSRGSAFGWAKHAALHSRFKFRSEDMDTRVLTFSQDAMLKAIKYVMTYKPTNDCVQMVYSQHDESGAERRTLRFVIDEASKKVESMLVPVSRVVGDDIPKWSFTVSGVQFLDLFDKLSLPGDVELRFMQGTDKARPDGAHFRTMERFLMDQTGAISGETAKKSENMYTCTVIRQVNTKAKPKAGPNVSV